MKKILLAVVTCLLLGTQAQAAFPSGRTFWVNANKASNTQSCTDSATDPGVNNSSQTIAQGIGCMSSGDTLNIQPGTYNERIDASTIPNGTNLGSGATVIQGMGPGLPGNTPGVIVQFADTVIPVSNNRHFIIFKNLKVVSTSAVWPSGGQDVINVGGGESTGAGSGNIRFDGIDCSTAGHGTGTDWNSCIALSEGGSGSNEIINSYFHDVSWPGGLQRNVVQREPHCLYVLSPNNLIDRNEFTRCAQYAIQNYTGDSVDAGNNTYSNNYIHDGGTTGAPGADYPTGGLTVYNASSGKIFNNVIVNWNSGISVAGNGTADNLQIYHNSIVNNVDATSSCCIAAIDIPANSGSTIRNNLLVGNSINSVNSGSNTASNNVTTGSAASHFVNAAGGDFHLLSGSGAIDAGANLGSPYNVDIAGITRTGTWDAGAYEFQGAPTGSYWVSTQGNDGNPCTLTATPQTTGAKRTIAAGIGCMSSGDTLRIRSGTYTESIGQNTLPSGTDDSNRTRVIAHDGPGTVTLGVNCCINSGGVIQTNAAWSEFDGINIDATNASTALQIEADHIRFKNSDMANTAKGNCPDTPAPQLCGPGHGISSANIGAVITISGGGFAEIINVVAHDTTYSGVDQGGGNCCQGAHGAYVQTANNTFDHFTVYNVGQHGIQFYHLGDITTSHDNVIKNSLIHDVGKSHQVGIIANDGYCVAANGNQSAVAGMVCYNAAWGVGAGDNTGVYESTFNNLQYGVTDGGAARTGIIVRGNIFSSVGVPVDSSTSGSGFAHSNNVCDSAGGGCDTVGNLLFTNLGAHDFRLQSNSVAIDAGVNAPCSLGITCVDYNGITRTGTWDAGAYEFQAGVVPPTPVVGLVLALGFNEGTGLPQDSSGYNNHVTSFQSGVTWQTTLCKYGNGCLSFNGNGGALVDDSPNLAAIYDSFTMEAWINPASAFNKFTSILDKVADPGPSGYLMLWAGTDSYFCPSTGPSGAFQSITGGSNPYVITCQNSVIAPGVWSHYAVTYDKTLANNNLKFYLNGTLIAQANSTETISATTGAALYIGSSIYTSSTYSEAFTGLMDDVRIYANVARTQAEIVADMNTPIAGGAAPAIPSSVKISSSSSIKLSPSSSVKVGVP